MRANKNRNIINLSFSIRNMRILYGVAGEGRGHSSRARAFIEHLQKQRHSVLVLAYGLAYKVLKKYFRVIKIDGIRFKFEKEKH